MDPVRGVDVGVLPEPPFRGGGPVRHPQAVPPAVLSLEQRELRAGMPLAAREDPHLGRPALELVPGGSFAQQPGELGDVGFFDLAGPVRAAGVRVRVIGAALADLAAAVNGDLPGRLRDQPQRGLLPSSRGEASARDSPLVRPGPVGQMPQQRQPGMRHDP